jgi:hypothetical protein
MRKLILQMQTSVDGYVGRTGDAGPMGRTSAEGQKRQFDRRLLTSGIPRQTDIRGARGHFSKVPIYGRSCW